MGMELSFVHHRWTGVFPLFSIVILMAFSIRRSALYMSDEHILLLSWFLCADHRDQCVRCIKF